LLSIFFITLILIGTTTTAKAINNQPHHSIDFPSF
jgi:hypothetical protein